MDFVPYDPKADVTKRHRNLPHWEQAGCTYFVTFRLGDAIPANKLEQWKEERDAWRKHHSDPMNESDWAEYQERFLDRIEKWSDAGYGGCVLRESAPRKILAGALHFFDGERYDLGDHVIMPNHVHLLVSPRERHRLGKIIHSWKSYSANNINEHLLRSGNLWMDERFDHLVRNSEQLHRIEQYIEENPKKAGLAASEYTLWKRPM